MEIGNNDKMYDICLNFSLGNVISEPIEVKGGLLHAMWKVTTDRGDFAVKCLNPAIMSRECALYNVINSEKISEILFELNIPAIIAKKIDTKHVHQYKEQYYMFFNWFNGKSIYPPEINEKYCNAIGDIIGKIHSLDIEFRIFAENKQIDYVIYKYELICTIKIGETYEILFRY